MFTFNQTFNPKINTKQANIPIEFEHEFLNEAQCCRYEIQLFFCCMSLQYTYGMLNH